MFKFLFGDKTTTVQAKQETQRETVLRAQKELNAVLAKLSPKARITIYPEEGTLTIELPEQMPDEAKALPAPSAASKPEMKPAEATKNAAPEKPATEAKPAEAPTEAKAPETAPKP